MTNIQHTPGPWLITNSHIANGEWVTGIYSEKEEGTLALVIGSKERAGYCNESETSVANACLISAAPELLEALKELSGLVVSNYSLIERMQFSETGRNLASKIKAAIAKAEGN